MANSEHYTAKEFKVTSEYKEFKAELYAKPREIKDSIPEIAQTPPETRFGNNQEAPSKKSASLRKKVKNLFDTLQQSASRLAGSVTGAIAVGGAAIAITVGIVSPPPQTPPTQFEDPAPAVYGATLNAPSLSESVVLEEDGKHILFLRDVFEAGTESGFFYSVTAFDSSGQEITAYSGQNSDAILVCDTPPAYLEYTELYRDGATQKAYATHQSAGTATPLSGVGDVSVENSTVLWGDTENEITLPLQYTQSNDALSYRLIFLGEDGTPLKSFEGNSPTAVISLPTETNVSAVKLQYVYREGEQQHLLYEKQLAGQLYLKSPAIEFLDKELVGGEYLITYCITSPNAALEEYIYLLVHEPVFDIEELHEGIHAGTPQYIRIPKDEAVSEITLSAELVMKGAYGGNERLVCATHTYQNELEFRHSVSYDLYNGQILFDFDYFAPPDSYVLVTNQDTATSETATGFYSVAAGSGSYHYTYQLLSSAGEPLSEVFEVRYDTPASTPHFDMMYTNPGNIVQTYNDDGTINLYADSAFSCDDPNVFYEVTFTGTKSYVLRSRDPLIEMTGLANDTYAVIYRVFYAENGTEYLIFQVSPSGTTEDNARIYFEADPAVYGSPALIIGPYTKPTSPIWITYNDNTLSLMPQDLTPIGSDEYHYYFSENINTLHVKLTVLLKPDDVAALQEKFGEDALKGSLTKSLEIDL